MKSEKVRQITEASALDGVRAESLAQQAFRSVRDAIFAGKFDPGEPLRELQLARMLAVSQATVREALVQLEQTGLVIREQNRRTTVSSFCKQEVRERLELRCVLEEMAAVGAVSRFEEGDCVKLDALALAIQETIDRNNYYEIVQADLRFHRYIWDRSGNAVLAKTLLQLTTPLFAFLGMMHQRGMTRTTKPHEPIVEAFRSKDAARVRHEIGYHLIGSYQEYLDPSATPADPTFSNHAMARAASA